MLKVRWIPNVAAMFFNSKDKWYSIVNSYSDPDVGYRHLDIFFKSVTSLMSNQLWSLVEKSISDLETYFSQFSSADSDVSVFSISLLASGVQIRFNPPLSDLDNVIMNMLEEIVNAVKEIPRVEMKLFTSLQGEQLYLPSISIQDSRINEGKFFKRIIARNTMAPQRHIATYEKFKPLLTLKAEKRVDDFLREKHELEEYEAVIIVLSANS